MNVGVGDGGLHLLAHPQTDYANRGSGAAEKDVTQQVNLDHLALFDDEVAQKQITGMEERRFWWEIQTAAVFANVLKKTLMGEEAIACQNAQLLFFQTYARRDGVKQLGQMNHRHAVVADEGKIEIVSNLFTLLFSGPHPPHHHVDSIDIHQELRRR